MKSGSRILATIAILLVSQSVIAEPSSGPISIVNVRPYAGSGVVYLHVQQSSFCSGNEVYTIPMDIAGGKEMYAIALTAIATGKKVYIEVFNSTGCAGWGTKLQSMTLVS